MKPSEVAPFDAYIFSEILDAAGVPAGVYNMINGDGPGVGTALSVAPRYRHGVVHRLNSGWRILVAQNAAPTVKRVAQELGGKSPNIILEDADLESAVKAGAAEVFFQYRAVLRCADANAGTQRQDGRSSRLPPPKSRCDRGWRPTCRGRQK